MLPFTHRRKWQILAFYLFCFVYVLSVLHHNDSSGLCHSCTQNIAPVEGQVIPCQTDACGQCGLGREGRKEAQNSPVLLRSSIFTSWVFLLERGGKKHPSFPNLSMKRKSSEKLNLSKGKRPREGKIEVLSGSYMNSALHQQTPV